MKSWGEASNDNNYHSLTPLVQSARSGEIDIDSLKAKLKGCLFYPPRLWLLHRARKQKGKRPFPDKRRHDDKARIANKKQRQHDRGNLSSAPQEEVEQCNKRMPFQSQLSRQGTMAIFCLSFKGCKKFYFCILFLWKWLALEESWWDKKFCRWVQLTILDAGHLQSSLDFS